MPINIKIVSELGEEIEKVLMNARKTLDGNILIFDHPDMNIMVMPSKSKIVSLPKEEIDDELYDSQKRFFKFLVNKGVVDYESVQDGNLFMTKEAVIPEVQGEGDKIQYCLYAISKFVEQELPFYKNMEQFNKDMEDNLLDPEIDEYTEFDATRHAGVKGTLPPRMVKYGIHSIYRL
tara:strand:- start:179 stop:709 length:531 start_codon:yes stop_codon:yes gene_type:complete